MRNIPPGVYLSGMTSTTPSKHVVIIGGVAGGMSAATRLRRLDPHASIIVLERSTYVSYANCGLPYHVSGVIADRDALILQTPEGLNTRFDIDVRVATEAIEIHPENQTVIARHVHTGEVYTLPYDALILSPGAETVIPPIPGIERGMPLRTVEDMDAMIAAINPEGAHERALGNDVVNLDALDGNAAKRPEHVTVIGGGYIGVEVAENLRHLDIPVTLVEAAPQVIAPLDIEMVMPVQDVMRRNGIDLRVNSQAAAIEDGAVVLANGDRIDTDLVVLAIGVRPDTRLAKAAGLELGPRGGIKVDEFLRTSVPGIYAVGDAVEKTDALDGSAALVPLANIANRQGRVVADHIAGLTPRPVPAQVTSILKVFNMTVATTGWNERRLQAAGRAYTAIHTHPGSHAGYYPGQELMMLKLLVDPQTQQILGAQGVGGDGLDKRIDVIATAMRGGITAPELMDLELAYAPPFSSAKDPVNMLGYVADNIAGGQTKTVQWHELAALQAQGVALVDVRTKFEFSRGSIPGAIHIPIDDLRHRLADLPKEPFVVFCQVGHRGHTATMYLRGIGLDVYNLDGGMRTWGNSPAAH